MADHDDDSGSEQGMFVSSHPHAGGSSSSPARGVTQGGKAPNTGVAGSHGIVRDSPVTGPGWGRGLIPVDSRKYKYDRTRGLAARALAFGASKADRLDADEAGDVLHRIHCTFNIDKVHESRIVAFDNALWLEHALNGGSMMRPGRGHLLADGVSFDVAPIRELLGVDTRRFYRAYADDIAATIKEVLDRYDPYDPTSVETVAQLKQVALERGLQKYPHLAFDAADACTNISMEERSALIASKGHVLASARNAVDGMRARPSASPFAEEVP